jgi:hypothetical protein
MDWISQELWLWYGDSMVIQVEETKEPVTAEWCREFVFEDWHNTRIDEGTALHTIFTRLLWDAEWEKIAERVNAVLED